MFILTINDSVKRFNNKVDDQVIGFQKKQQEEAEIQNARLDKHDKLIEDLQNNRPTST